ncbi:MAG TPA: hypothetical protein PKC45_14450 [Gemmatales bacterium]|nr:hypothetical protein [Gemmatales bacterium]
MVVVGTAPAQPPRDIPGGNRPIEELTPEEAKARIGYLTATWKQAIERKIAGNRQLRDLTNRNRYYFIHARTMARTQDYSNCAFNFVVESMDQEVHKGNVHFVFQPGNDAKVAEVNVGPGSHNLIADLGPVDFNRDVDPRSIDVTREDGWRLATTITEGHVYLIRVFDDSGNRFFVMMKVFHMPENGEYLAFVFRLLPGGVTRKPYLG